MRKRYDTPATPCDRLLACAKVDEETKRKLRALPAALDPWELAAEVERRRAEIFAMVAREEEDWADEIARAAQDPGDPGRGT